MYEVSVAAAWAGHPGRAHLSIVGTDIQLVIMGKWGLWPPFSHDHEPSNAANTPTHHGPVL